MKKNLCHDDVQKELNNINHNLDNIHKLLMWLSDFIKEVGDEAMERGIKIRQ